LLSATFQDDSQAKAISFLGGYGEHYDWLKEVFRDWTFTFLSSFMYYHDQGILDKDSLALYRKRLACFEGNVFSYHLALRDHTVMVWDFHSLMLAIKFLFSIRLTDLVNPMRLCDHCRKAFIAKRANSKFCSVKCSERATKKK